MPLVFDGWRVFVGAVDCGMRPLGVTEPFLLSDFPIALRVARAVEEG